MTLSDTNDAGASQTPVGGLLRSANGHLDITVAWRWDQFQIMDWFKELVKNPQMYGIDSEYIDPSETVEAGKHLKLKYVVEYIGHLRYDGFISDPSYNKFLFDPRKAVHTHMYPQTTYARYELPVRTLYDAVGWILSITAVPASNTANQNNFCLPLIGLFGKWCSVLLPVDSLPVMLHVAYWNENERFRLLLGATPGNDQIMYSSDKAVWHKTPLESWEGELPPRSTISAKPWSANKSDDIYWGVRGWDIIARRQDMFEKYKFVINDSHKHRIDRLGMYEAKSGFGRCAETFIYLWMLQRKAHHGNVEKIHGFALNPTAGFNKGWVTNQTEYNPCQLTRGLREPCQATCQELMMHYFREDDCDKCLFRLEHMDELEDGQKPYAWGRKKLERTS